MRKADVSRPVLLGSNMMPVASDDLFATRISTMFVFCFDIIHIGVSFRPDKCVYGRFGAFADHTVMNDVGVPRKEIYNMCVDLCRNNVSRNHCRDRRKVRWETTPVHTSRGNHLKIFAAALSTIFCSSSSATTVDGGVTTGFSSIPATLKSSSSLSHERLIFLVLLVTGL